MSKSSINNLAMEKGIKKKFIAEKLGIRPETFSRKMNNPETFNAFEMAILSDVLKTPINEINFNVNFFTNRHDL